MYFESIHGPLQNYGQADICSIKESKCFIKESLVSPIASFPFDLYKKEL